MRAFALAMSVVALSLALTSCAAMSKDRPAEPERAAVHSERQEAPNFYYEFDDILVPRELALVIEDSQTIEDEKFKAGIQVFEGRVVTADLINFFLNNMAKDGWRLTRKAMSKNTTLDFDKANKRCTISILDGFKTRVTVFAVEAKATLGAGAAKPAREAK
jgi:hypothetical protein